MSRKYTPPPLFAILALVYTKHRELPAQDHVCIHRYTYLLSYSETLRNITLGGVANILCFRCEFTADSQAQGCQVDIRDRRTEEVEQSFSLSRSRKLMTCTRELPMEGTEYEVVAREIEVSGRVGTEMVGQWEPPFLSPPSSTSSTHSPLRLSPSSLPPSTPSFHSLLPLSTNEDMLTGGYNN